MAKLNVSKTVESLGEYLHDQRRQAQLSLRQLADQAGVSNPYLSQIERGLRRPSAEVLQQIAKALRISAESLYVRAGILDVDESGSRAVVHAISVDSALTERQRNALLDIYHSFVGSAVNEPAVAQRDPAQSDPIEPGLVASDPIEPGLVASDSQV